MSSDGITPEIERAQWAEWRASRRKLIGASFAVAGSFAIGGSKFAVRSASAQDASPTPVMGGSISMSLSDDDVASFDPIAGSDNMSIWTVLLVFDQLIRVAADGNSLEPSLAEKWERSDDGLTYTFHLRQGVTFHDGSAVTADDVVYSLNRVATDPGSDWSFLYAAIDTLTASDANTVVAKLKQVWVPFEADLALSGASIIPKALHTAQGDAFWDNPVGSGAFKFSNWQKGAQLTLVKNPTYWDQPKPYLDELDFMVLTDANGRMLQFQNGSLDIATDVPYSQLDALKQNSDVDLQLGSIGRMDFLWINTTRAPWDDKILRQAINYAIDKDSIIKNIYFGAATMQNTCLPLMYGHADDVVGYPFDLDKAKSLVAQSQSPNGFKGTLIVSTSDDVGGQIAQLVVANLKAIGGDISIQQLDPSAASDLVVHQQNYDFYKSYSTTDIIDPDELVGFYVEQLPEPVAALKGTNFLDLVNQGRTEADETKRLDIYKQIQQLHSDYAVMGFLVYPQSRTALQPRVKNFRILPTGNYRLYETWVED